VIDCLQHHAAPPIPLIPAKAGTQAGTGVTTKFTKETKTFVLFVSFVVDLANA
jgi:hypothetical protein